MARRSTRNAATNSKAGKQPKSPAKPSLKSPAKSPVKITLKKQTKQLAVENTNLRRSKRLSNKALNNVFDEQPANATPIKAKFTPKKKSESSTSNNEVLPNSIEPMEVDEVSKQNVTCTVSESFKIDSHKVLISPKLTSANIEVCQTDGVKEKPANKTETGNSDALFKMPFLPAPRAKARTKSKKTKDPLNELSNFFNSVLTIEANLSKCNIEIPEMSDQTMKNIDAVLNSFTESNLPKPTVESLAVQVDVLRLIAEKLNQTEEFKFSEKFAQFEQYLDPSVTETAVLCIEDRVLRLEVLYIRLMVDIVSSVHDDDTLFRQEGMQAILLEQVKYYEMQKQTFFGVNQLFPAFYFVVRRLVEEFQNWEQLPWLADNNLPCHSFDILEEKVEEEKYTLESRISRLLRRRDDAWCSVLNITKNLLQRSIDKDVFVRINDSIDYNTGTVYLFLILVAKCYQSAVFYNRLEVNFDDQINRRHSWKAFTEFGKLFHEYYESGGVIQELTTLFYPLLFHQQNGRLVLSVTDVVTLTCQLAEMNFETYSHYQCMYFQMAFSAIHYHLIWEQLEKNNALKSGARYLIPFTTFDMITTWESVFKNFSSAYSIPFTQQNANYSTWNVIKPRWVIILLTLLTTIARKYIYSEFVNRTARNEFPYLKSVFKHFDRILGKNQLTGHAIVAAF